MTNVMTDVRRWREFTEIANRATELLCDAQSNFADKKFVKYCSKKGAIVHQYLLDCLALDSAEWQMEEQFDIAHLLKKLPLLINNSPMGSNAKMALIISLCTPVDGVKDIISKDRPNDLRWIVSAALTYHNNNFPINACLSHLEKPEILDVLFSLKFGKHDGGETDMDLFVYATALQSPDFALHWLILQKKKENFKPTPDALCHWVYAYIEMISDYERFPNCNYAITDNAFEFFFDLAGRNSEECRISLMKHTLELASLAAERLLMQMINIDKLVILATIKPEKAVNLPMLIARAQDCRKYTMDFIENFSQLAFYDQKTFYPLLNKLALLQQQIQANSEQKDLVDEKQELVVNDLKKNILSLEEKLLANAKKQEKLEAKLAAGEKLLAQKKSKTNKKSASTASNYDKKAFEAAKKEAAAAEAFLLAKLNAEEAIIKQKEEARKQKEEARKQKEEAQKQKKEAPRQAEQAPKHTKKTPRQKAEIQRQQELKEAEGEWQQKGITKKHKKANQTKKETEARKAPATQASTAPKPAAKPPTPIAITTNSVPISNPASTMPAEPPASNVKPTIVSPAPKRPTIYPILSEEFTENKEIPPQEPPISEDKPAAAAYKKLNADAQEFIPMAPPYHFIPASAPFPFFAPPPYVMPPSIHIFPFEAIPVNPHLASAPAMLVQYNLDYYGELVANAINNNSSDELHNIMKPLPDEIRLILLQRNEALLLRAMECGHVKVLLAALDCFNNKSAEFKFHICEGIDFNGDNFVTAVRKMAGTDKLFL